MWRKTWNASRICDTDIDKDINYRYKFALMG